MTFHRVLQRAGATTVPTDGHLAPLVRCAVKKIVTVKYPILISV